MNLLNRFQYIFKVIITTFILLSTNAYSDSIEDFTRKVDEYKGQVIYVDFWASWCTPCVKSFPWMNKMQSQHSAAGFKVLSVNLDANLKDAKDFLVNYPAKFDVIFDPDGKIAKKYKLQGMPSSFIIDRNGKAVSAHVGFNQQKQVQYEKEINALLVQ